MRNPLQPRRAVIKKIKEETYNTKTFTFEFADGGPKGLEFFPGQFTMLSIPGYGEAAISIAQDPDDDSGLDLTIREVGSVTGALFRRDVDEEVWIRGPYGNGWPVPGGEVEKVMILTGGCGNGASRPVILGHRNDPTRYGEIEVLHGARTPRDVIYRKEYEEEWPRIKDCSVLLSSDRVHPGQSWDHKVGLVTTLFEDMETNPDGSIVYMCGPEIMMKFAAMGLVDRGFSSEQIFCSMERRMRCGIGLCGHCQLGPKYVCKDGPIFSYAELSKLPDHIVRR